MSAGLAFLGGFVTGGVVVFVVTAWAVFRPRYIELHQRWIDERNRRIEAEDNDGFAFLAPIDRHNWGAPVPFTDAVTHNRTHSADTVLDLTNIDDPEV